jgi:hypothetical protein
MAALEGYGFKYTRKISGNTPFGTVGNEIDDTVFCENNVGGQNVKVPAGATVQLPWAWTRSLMKVFEFSAKVDPALTAANIGNLSPANLLLKSNSPSSPGDTATLVPKAGYHWFKGVDPDANMPFSSADVTALYAVNSGPLDLVFTFAGGGDHP